MSSDLRVGRKDHQCRYIYYAINTKIKDVLTNKVQALGRFYCKEIAPRQISKSDMGNVARSTNVELTLETTDRVNLVPDMLLKREVDDAFFIIRTIEDNIDIQSQVLSKRPIKTKTIQVRGCNV